ncbi:hypothetical protein SBI_09423 [Streptomyces bingchenggensis BCW-1]|uniref:Uncharacterized protein n=1 Tax=Streptomyces bingchenggensis (strain BCW-1) TaxID=749414 RepID=D7C7J3_STRBB|nr:hypothetical protein SBI_09423 [Streptomyces bingchenggensis BCW-1]
MTIGLLLSSKIRNGTMPLGRGEQQAAGGFGQAA